MATVSLNDIADAFNDFKEANKGRLDGIESAITDMQKKVNRAEFGNPGSQISSNEASAPFFVNVAGKQIPLLAKTDKIAAHYPKTAEDQFSLSGYVRQEMGFVRNALTSGPATVPGYVGAEIIDLVRAASTVVEAGASTINIEGTTNFAKITGDPTVYQHTEGAADISESDMTLAAVEANPKALVALVPLSEELVSGSPNLDAALNMSLSAAFAAKLDALCIARILADTNIPDSAVAHDPATWAGVLAAVGAALALDQKLPAAHIGNTADFIARASQLASTAGSWLGKPPVLSNMAELPTTGITAGTAIFGDFQKGFAITVRQDIRLEVVRFSKATAYSHVLVAHARMDGLVLQPARLFIEKKTV